MSGNRLDEDIEVQVLVDGTWLDGWLDTWDNRRPRVGRLDEVCDGARRKAPRLVPADARSAPLASAFHADWGDTLPRSAEVPVLLGTLWLVEGQGHQEDGH